MSYILFAKTSDPFGTRDTWQLGELEQLLFGNTADGVVNGEETEVVSSDFVAPTGVNTADAAAYDLSFTGDLATDADAIEAIGDVILGQEIAFEVADITDPANGLVDRTLTVEIVDPEDWNSIKNVELFLTSGDAAQLDAIVVNAFVDTRIKVGDSFRLPAQPVGDPLIVEVRDAKRGEIDASALDRGVVVFVGATSNGAGWQNSFELIGTAFNDNLFIGAGTFDVDNLGGQWTGTIDGSLTTVTADLGAGNDIFVSVANTQYRAVVSMGDGDDLIQPLGGDDTVDGGNGNDRFVVSAGNDVLTGGDGADSFQVIGPENTTITDFVLGTDTLTYFFALGVGPLFRTAADFEALLGAFDANAAASFEVTALGPDGVADDLVLRPDAATTLTLLDIADDLGLFA